MLPPATRIRENQRRSRERRKQLIDELQQRLHQYETKEIEATIEVQLAARRVVWENSRLRSLLASKGVSDQEITQFMQSEDDGKPAGITKKFNISTPDMILHAQNKTGKPNTLGFSINPSISVRKGDDGQKNCTDAVICRDSLAIEVEGGNPAISFSKLRPLAPYITYSNQHSSPIPQEAVQSPLHSEPVSNGAHVDQSNDGAYSSMDFGDEKSMIRMPCETAANIIVGLPGIGDEAGARRELGCTGELPCNVENTKVLEILAME